MSLGDLISQLGYKGSANFLQGGALETTRGYAHVFRRAVHTCELRGVYTLKEAAEQKRGSVVPVVYVCEANSMVAADGLHRLVWNQNVVPFLIVYTPQATRLYSGFRYGRDASGAGSDGLLEPRITLKQVAAVLGGLRADAIDSGRLWKEWQWQVSTETRVDWQLLHHLEQLGDWLRTNGLKKRVAHALIGKYVYLRYLKDREILSPRKFEEWAIHADSVFGREATLDGLKDVLARLDEWLNGSVFPLDLDGPDTPAAKHLKRVAAVFAGDDPVTGQMHLPFERYDFSHIPIETLSVIYEQFLHAEGKGKREGAYYTPIPVVNFILEELDDQLPLRKGMRVFDASCGSGAFLVQCYRRLIERRRALRPDGKITPKELRAILVKHIYGIEQNPDACEVAELSLILTLLDYVNPPDLTNNHGFKIPKLLKRNIFRGDFFDKDAPWVAALCGRRFHWIVGNPPWKELKSTTGRKTERRALAWMNSHEKDFPTGGNQLAEAFAWEVARHSEPGGMIGLLLPATSLFKAQSANFRREFFEKMRVQCVANFANLAYILFEGRAELPAAAFFYSQRAPGEEIPEDECVLTYAPLVANQEAIKPVQSRKRKKAWSIVVNASEITEILTQEAAAGDSVLWKMAMWGSGRDRRLLQSLEKRFPTLQKLEDDKRIVVREGLQLRDKDAPEETEFVEEVVGKNLLEVKRLRGKRRIFSFPAEALTKVKKRQAYVRLRKEPLKVCRPPHVVVHASRNFAVYTDDYLVVPPRQIGIAGDERQRGFLKALSLYLSSDFVIYHQFLMSPEWGVHSNRATKDALMRLPVPLAKLSADQLAEWEELHAALLSARPEAPPRKKSEQPSLFDVEVNGQESIPAAPTKEELLAVLNDRVYKLLGLKPWERTLVEDLVHIKMQLIKGKVANAVLRAPSEGELRDYAEQLLTELDAFVHDQRELSHQVRVIYDGWFGVVLIDLLRDQQARPVEVAAADSATRKDLHKIRKAVQRRHSQWLYFNRNLRVFAGTRTMVFKPLQLVHWTQSQALNDADQVIAETLSLREE